MFKKKTQDEQKIEQIELRPDMGKQRGEPPYQRQKTTVIDGGKGGSPGYHGKICALFCITVDFFEHFYRHNGLDEIRGGD